MSTVNFDSTDAVYQIAKENGFTDELTSLSLNPSDYARLKKACAGGFHLIVEGDTGNHADDKRDEFYCDGAIVKPDANIEEGKYAVSLLEE